MDHLKPAEIKQLRQEYGIPAIEVAAWTGLPSGLIQQIEDEAVVVLETDLERMTAALRKIILERTRTSR